MVNSGSINTIDFGREFCPEAVNQWCNATADYSSELSEKVKKHLAFMGWVFWYANGKRELRYQSPWGKVYYSLITACQAFLQQHDLTSTFSFKVRGRGRGRPRKNSCFSPKLPDFSPSEQKDSCLNPKLSRKRNFSSSNSNPNPPERRSQRLKHTDKQINYIELDLELELSMLPSSSELGSNPIPSSYNHPSRSRCILSKLIDINAVSLLSKVYYRDTNGNPLKTGLITREGIQCDCCSTVFALSPFEAHAGSTKHRPAANIMLDDGSGRSLSDCKIQFLYSVKANGKVRDSMMKSSKKKSITRKKSPRSVKEKPHQESDRICSICRCDNDEDLMYCDQCPSVFHANCLGLKKIQDRDWVCPSCCCVICSNGSLSKDNDDSLLTCQQCERKFHVGCCTGVMKSMELNESWFCSHSCSQVFSGLQMLAGKPISLGNNLTWTLLKCTESKAATAEHKKLRVALDVLHECFEPSKDIYTGRDMTKDVIFGRESKLKRVNFRGFYTVILEKDDDAATVATVRVFGNKVAEMPLVGTRFRYRQQGLCRALVDELEKHLTNIGVEKLVLPSVVTTLDTWTQRFGFSKMTDEDRSKLLLYTFLDFQGTIMCQKLLKTVIDLDSDLE